MAVYFNLAVNFGNSEKNAHTLATFFRNKKIVLSNRVEVPLELFVGKTRSGQWMVSCYPTGMNMGSPAGSNLELSDKSKPYFKEIERFFYTELRQCPEFDYALFGGEAADIFLDITSLSTEFLQDPTYIWKGLVIQDKYLGVAGPREYYQPFRDGYSWVPTIH